MKAWLVLFVLVACNASAQTVPGDGLLGPLATSGQRHVADVTSTVGVAGAIGLDLWHDWHDEHGSTRWQATALCELLRYGGAYGLSTGLKHAVHQWRPDRSDAMSFPSEHTMMAAAAFGGRSWVVTVPLASTVGLLRVGAGKHYLVSDVLPGLGSGLLIGWLTHGTCDGLQVPG